MTRSRLFALFSVFLLSVAFLGLGPVCLLIECNLQQTIHGQVSLSVPFGVEEGWPTLGEAPSLAVKRLATVLTEPSCRAAALLWRLQLQGAAYLWELAIPG